MRAVASEKSIVEERKVRISFRLRLWLSNSISGPLSVMVETSVTTVVGVAIAIA